MYPNKLLQKGNFVRIINEDHPLYEEIGEISFLEKSGDYRIKTPEGGEFLIRPQDCVPWIGWKQERELHKAHLIQLQHLAVETGDEQWFAELGQMIRDMGD